MRIPSRRRDVGLKFDITPLIDIVFNLVIFFLVGTHFANSEAHEAVALPEASQTDERPPAPRRLMVTVLRDGSFSVGGRAATPEEVAAMIAEDVRGGTADYEVQIRGDRSAPFDAVTPLLVACARHGVTAVKVSKLDR